jgi:hypothetical protein
LKLIADTKTVRRPQTVQQLALFSLHQQWPSSAKAGTLRKACRTIILNLSKNLFNEDKSTQKPAKSDKIVHPIMYDNDDGNKN